MYFASPLRAGPGQQTTQSLRASQYDIQRKRRRGEDYEEPPISPDEAEEDTAASSNTQLESSFVHRNSSQLRVAGLLPGDTLEPPASPFPHAPARASKSNFGFNNVQKELAALRPPLYVPNATSKSSPADQKSDKPARRQTHLEVLTTVLHHCLLVRDYQRAGRAWGMLLRSRVAGRPIDLRRQGRWGIGAEILLHRDSQQQTTQTEDDAANSQKDEDGQPSYTNGLFTEEGFELAKEYYERLIVQYPNHKHIHDAIDELTFYPAMFSLWIFEVCDKSKRRREKVKESAQRSESQSDVSDADTTMESIMSTSSEEVEIRSEELQQATAIAERLDQLLISPPFDKHGDLLRLRGMVALWVSDLQLPEAVSKSEEDESESESNVDTESSVDSSKIEGVKERLAGMQRAKEFFDRAQQNGNKDHRLESDIDTKIKRLEERLHALGFE